MSPAPSTPRAVLRLVRVSLFASALADPWLGYALGGGTRPLEAFGLALASLGVYHGGMALNDWVDREADRRAGRDRPLVSGALTAQQGLGIAVGLLAFGVLVPWLFGLGWAAGVCIAVAALAAVVYDVAGRGAVRGPLLLALARGANLLFGAAAAGALGASAWVAALLYAALVATVSALGRFEDGEAALDATPRRPSQLLRLAAGLLLGAPLVIAVLHFATHTGAAPPWWTLLLVAAALWLLRPHAALLRRLATRARWTPADVEGAMGPALGSLGLFTVATLLAIASAPFGLGLAVCAFGLQRLGRQLMRRFPPS